MWVPPPSFLQGMISNRRHASGLEEGDARPSALELGGRDDGARDEQPESPGKKAPIARKHGEFTAELGSRLGLLAGLMVVQSLSSVILARFEGLLREHLVVTLFLTMLVGAGGNAGNQAAVKVIRGLATGEVPAGGGAAAVLRREAAMGACLGAALFALAFARVMVSDGDPVAACAIAIAAFAIVLASVVVGAALPLALARAGLDPAHAGPAIQVIMDISGVAISCATCAALFSFFGAPGAPAGAPPAPDGPAAP